MRTTEKLKLCIFIHHSTDSSLPFYVIIYINQLSQFFDVVTLLTDNYDLLNTDVTLPENVKIEIRENKGYDFGKFYQYFTMIEHENFSRIAIINDSNILVNQLNKVFSWGENCGADFWGLIDSNEKPWFSKHENNYHIQSHFLVLNENAIKILPGFLGKIDIRIIMEESKQKQLRRLVIEQWEIGLSQYFLQSGLKIEAFIKTTKSFPEFNPEKLNAVHSHYKELIMSGYPLLKVKVVKAKKKWYQRKDSGWKDLIKNHADKKWSERLLNEVNTW